MTLKIIYEDQDILVIDKPPGLVVDKSETQKGLTLVDWLRKKYDKQSLPSREGRLVYHSEEAQGRMGVVHRLDKDTSGVILIAKNDSAFENLQTQFKERKTKKEYLALVHGLVEKGGVIEGAIGRNPGNREKFAVLQNPTSHRIPTSEVGYREAVTEYSPEGKFQIVRMNEFSKEKPNDKYQIIFNDLNKIQMRKLERMSYNQFTLLRCYPKTGRTHQIRVHLKYTGHPIVSDEKYAGRKMVRLDKRWCPRMFLHAKRLGFYHPVSGEWMEVESKLPEDLKEALSNLKS